MAGGLGIDGGALSRGGSDSRRRSRLILRQSGNAERKPDECNRVEGATCPERERAENFHGGALPFLQAMETCPMDGADTRLVWWGGWNCYFAVTLKATGMVFGGKQTLLSQA